MNCQCPTAQPDVGVDRATAEQAGEAPQCLCLLVQPAGGQACAELREWREFALAMWVQLGEATERYEARIRELQQENANLAAEIERQNEALSYYPNSLSWRVTAPLRTLRKIQN